MGLDDLLPQAFLDKRLRKKALEAAGSLSSASPVIKTVQAAYQIVKIGDTIKSANNFIGHASDTAKAAQVMIPQMHIMGRSLVDSARLFSQFSMLSTTLGIGANIIQTYQGIQALNLIAAKLGDISHSLEAQAALTAQRDFPQYVHDMIRERLIQTSVDPDRDHWFFLYHPDTDWYPKFFHLVEEKPLDGRFCGYTNQLDTVFMFMVAARQRITERELRYGRKREHCRPVQLHLVVPAYQSVLIIEPMQIPEEIGDFVIEGRINSNRPFVWFNLPESQKCYTSDVGIWVPPPRAWWNKALTWCGLTEKPHDTGKPRILGLGPPLEDDALGATFDLKQSIEKNESMLELQKGSSMEVAEIGDKEKQVSMPLHQRRSSTRHSSRRRRRSRS